MRIFARSALLRLHHNISREIDGVTVVTNLSVNPALLSRLTAQAASTANETNQLSGIVGFQGAVCSSCMQPTGVAPRGSQREVEQM
jgi:hypothetical protein